MEPDPRHYWRDRRRARKPKEQIVAPQYGIKRGDPIPEPPEPEDMANEKELDQK